MLTVGSGFDTSFDLPAEKVWHNLVAINNTHQVLLGGQSDTIEVYLFNWDGGEWTQLPSLNAARMYSQAGLVTYPNGTRAIIAAGGRFVLTSEIWVIDSDEWIVGPNLPFDGSYLQEGASVSYQDSFLIVGGELDGDLAQDTIISFNTVTEDWEILPQRLENARRIFAAFMIPNSFINCV